MEQRPRDVPRLRRNHKANFEDGGCSETSTNRGFTFVFIEIASWLVLAALFAGAYLFYLYLQA